MNFKTNLSALSLLGKQTIKFYFDNKIVEFVPPNLNLYQNDLEFSRFRGFLKCSPEEFYSLNKEKLFIVNNHYEVLQAFLKLKYYNDFILKYFNILFPNLTYKNDNFYANDEKLEFEEYEILLKALEVSCGERDIKDFEKQSELAEIKNPALKKMKEREDKIKELKNKKKSTEKEKSQPGSKITIDQIVVSLVYEYGFSIEEIYQMNMFSILYFWSYVSKIVDTKIMVVAAGNGLTKEFTYFIN